MLSLILPLDQKPYTSEADAHSLTLTALNAEEQAWFDIYKQRPSGVAGVYATPAHIREEMARHFGQERMWELATLFERTPLPPRPGQWNRRVR